jgi:hypothetical protein
MVIVLHCKWPWCHCFCIEFRFKVKCASTLTPLLAKYWQHLLHGHFSGDTIHHWHLSCSLVDIFILGNASDNMIKVPDRRSNGFSYWKAKHMWGQNSTQDFSESMLMRNDKGWKKKWKINNGGLAQHPIKQYLLFFCVYVLRVQIKYSNFM